MGISLNGILKLDLKLEIIGQNLKLVLLLPKNIRLKLRVSCGENLYWKNHGAEWQRTNYLVSTFLEAKVRLSSGCSATRLREQLLFLLSPNFQVHQSLQKRLMFVGGDFLYSLERESVNR